MEQMRSLCLEGALKSMGPIFQAQKETKKMTRKVEKKFMSKC